MTSTTRLRRVSQNIVFEVDGERPSVLRVSRGRGRSVEQIEAELDWLEDLAARGVDVCLPRLSVNGRRCEQLTLDGDACLVVHFDRAPGRKVERADVSLELYRSLGAVTGRLHAASFDHALPQPRRPMWYESRLLTSDFELLGSRLTEDFRAAVAGLIHDLRASRAPLRLVHGDISFGNTFLDGNRLWIFDFDNCEVGSIAQDLATMLYDGVFCHFLNRVADDRLTELVKTHWRAFLEGYRSVRMLEPIDVETLRRFAVLREAVIYVHYLRILDPAKLTDSFRAGLELMRHNVEQGVTQIELTTDWLN